MNVYNPALVWWFARDPRGPTWALKHGLEACICCRRAFRWTSETFSTGRHVSSFDLRASFDKNVALADTSKALR